MNGMPLCSTCLQENDRHVPNFLKTHFKAFEDCKTCKVQWNEFYTHKNPVSPLMRAIECEKQATYRATHSV